MQRLSLFFSLQDTKSTKERAKVVMPKNLFINNRINAHAKLNKKFNKCKKAFSIHMKNALVPNTLNLFYLLRFTRYIKSLVYELLNLSLQDFSLRNYYYHRVDYDSYHYHDLACAVSELAHTLNTAHRS